MLFKDLKRGHKFIVPSEDKNIPIHFLLMKIDGDEAYAIHDGSYHSIKPNTTVLYVLT